MIAGWPPWAVMASSQSFLAGVFPAPTPAVQGLALWRRGPSGVLIAGAVGLASLARLVADTWIACSAEPRWIGDPNGGEGGRPVFPCDAPTAFFVHGFLRCGAPAEALLIVSGTALQRRLARGRRAAATAP